MILCRVDHKVVKVGEKRGRVPCGTRGAVFALIGFLLSAVTLSKAQTFEVPGETRPAQEFLAAGPFSKLNLATGTLATSVPLIDLPSFPNLRLKLALIHNSGVEVSGNRSAARNWLHTGHEYLFREHQAPFDDVRFGQYWLNPGYSNWTHGDDGTVVGRWYTTQGIKKTAFPGFATRDYCHDEPRKITVYGSKSYTLFGFELKKKEYKGPPFHHWSTVNLVTEQNNGLGPDGKGDRIVYAYDGKDRLSTITEIARNKTKYRSIKINYASRKDAIASVDLNYKEAGVAKKRTWTIGVDNIGSALLSVDGPISSINPRSTARFFYTNSRDGKRILYETDQTGGMWCYEYDTKGRVKEIRPPDPSLGGSVNSGTGIRIEYVGDLTKVTDQLGRLTVYTHSGTDVKTLRRIDYPAYQTVGPGGVNVGAPVATSETFSWQQDEIASYTDRRGSTTTLFLRDKGQPTRSPLQ